MRKPIRHQIVYIVIWEKEKFRIRASFAKQYVRTLLQREINRIEKLEIFS